MEWVALREISPEFKDELKELITEVLDERKLDKYLDGYRSNIGAYAFMSIHEIDNNVTLSKEVKDSKRQKILDALLDEFDNIAESSFTTTHILFNLQLNEYQLRNKIDDIKKA